MRTKYKLNTKILDNNQVCYTCPSCGVKNTHNWYGREVHYCTECGYATDIKGVSEPAVKFVKKPKYTLQMYCKHNQCWRPIKLPIKTQEFGIKALDAVAAVERTTPFRLVERYGTDCKVVAQRLLAQQLIN